MSDNSEVASTLHEAGLCRAAHTAALRSGSVQVGVNTPGRSSRRRADVSETRTIGCARQ